MLRSLTSRPLAALAAAVLVLGAAACDEENTDLVLTRDLPAPVDTVFVDDPISLTVTRTETRRVEEGTAYSFVNGENTAYLLASESVTVECPGSLRSSWRLEDGETFFRFQFVVTPNGPFVIDANFNAEIDGRRPTLLGGAAVTPGCVNPVFDIDYVIDGDRITGTLRGEFAYLVPVPNFPNTCEDWVNVGDVEVAFDLPLRSCN